MATKQIASIACRLVDTGEREIIIWRVQGKFRFYHVSKRKFEQIADYISSHPNHHAMVTNTNNHDPEKGELFMTIEIYLRRYSTGEKYV